MKKNKVKKLKVRKSVKKRFRLTPTGKIVFRGSHVRHLRRKKKKANLRRQKVAQTLDKTRAKKIKKLLG